MNNTALDLRIMTFNIRQSPAADGANGWRYRKDLACDVVRAYGPDILGVQEAYIDQLHCLKAHLPGHEVIGTGRDGGDKGEHAAIFYQSSRFSVKDSGMFWLSETPEKPSMAWGTRYRRVCTWARFKENLTGREFFVYNTHLDHEVQLARINGLRLITDHMKERVGSAPFLLIGDLNAPEDAPATLYVKKKSENNPLPMVDSWRELHPEEAVAGTVHVDFDGKEDGDKIDYIFVPPGTRVLEADIIRTSRHGRYPSDHFPVTARLSFE